MQLETQKIINSRNETVGVRIGIRIFEQKYWWKKRIRAASQIKQKIIKYQRQQTNISKINLWGDQNYGETPQEVWKQIKVKICGKRRKWKTAMQSYNLHMELVMGGDDYDNNNGDDNKCW